MNILNALIVDDNEINIKTIEYIFEDTFEGLNFISATNGEDGLKVLLSKKIDLIISDYMMPKMDGLEFVKIIKQNPKWKNIPIFILTAYGEESIEKQFLNFGIFDFINKPINNNSIISFKNKIKTIMDLELIKKQKQRILELESKEKDKIILQQSRLAIMGEMLSMIAHQWRQPLNAINSITMRMNMQKEMGLLNDQKFNENIQDIRDSTNFLTNTINDFRKFFDRDKRKLKIIPKEIIKKVINLISHRINELNIKIIEKCDYPKKEILTYPSELQQVFLNILNNACDQFKVQEIKNPVIKIEGKFQNSDSIKIIISDNAGGILENIISKIFNPYFSTKSKNGTGLGLYMSKMIIHDSIGGKLTVKNDKYGAVFEMIIPKNIL